LIVRNVFENCEDKDIGYVSDYVRWIFTVGTPNMGINMACLTTTMSYEDYLSDKPTIIGPFLTSIGCKLLFGEANPKIYFHKD